MNKRARLAAGFLALLLVLSLNAPAFAADSAAGTTIRLEETEGTVTVKNASGKAQSVRADMRLYNGYTVTTGKSSSAYISMDGTKAVKLDSSSKAEVKKSGSQLEVSLLSGNVFFNVTEPLKSTETLNIRTSTMVTGIRGSFGWVGQKEVGLVHGSVVVTCTDPATGAVHTETMQSGESVRYVPEGTEGAPAEQAFVKSGIKTEDVPLIVVEEVAKDETLQAQIAEDVPQIDVTELIGNIETLREEAAAEEETAQEQLDAQTAAQTEELSGATSGPVYAEVVEEAAAASSSSDDGSYTPPAAPSVVTAPANATTANVENLLAQSTTTTVNVATTAGTLQDLANLSVPAGKTLNITGNGAVNTEDLKNSGTINVAEGATLNIFGTSSNLSANTIVNNGTVKISGTFHNGGGIGGSAGRFVNNGKLLLADSDSRFVNHYNGTMIRGSSGTVEGGSIEQMWLVTFASNGGSEVVSQEVTEGTRINGVLSKLAAPTKSNNAFAGWYTDSDLKNRADSAENTGTVTGNLTLYAKWLENKTVFVYNYGEQGVSYITLDGTAATAGLDSSTSSLTVGWYTMAIESSTIRSAQRLSNQIAVNRNNAINNENNTLSDDGNIYYCNSSTQFIVYQVPDSGSLTASAYTGISNVNITPSPANMENDENVYKIYFVYDEANVIIYLAVLDTNVSASVSSSGYIFVTGTGEDNATVTGVLSFVTYNGDSLGSYKLAEGSNISEITRNTWYSCTLNDDAMLLSAKVPYDETHQGGLHQVATAYSAESGVFSSNATSSVFSMYKPSDSTAYIALDADYKATTLTGAWNVTPSGSSGNNAYGLSIDGTLAYMVLLAKSVENGTYP